MKTYLLGLANKFVSHARLLHRQALLAADGDAAVGYLRHAERALSRSSFVVLMVLVVLVGIRGSRRVVTRRMGLRGLLRMVSRSLHAALMVVRVVPST